MTEGKNIVETSLAPKAIGTYSQGVEFNGTWYFSGQIGLDPESMNISNNFDDQLDQVMANIDGLLKSSGLTRDHIIKSTIFLTNLDLFGKVNEVYKMYFRPPYPARSCVQVTALPKGALVEIEVIAAKQ